MKRKPIRVNWDELEAAFDNQNSDLVYYVDLVNGHVVLDGEGEVDEEDEDDPDYAAAVSDPTRAYIELLSEDTKVDWIRRYVAESAGLAPDVRTRLDEALATDRPADGIIATFRDNPAAKDHWYLYRADRLHDRIEEWLQDNGIDPIDPPPWRTPS